MFPMLEGFLLGFVVGVVLTLIAVVATRRRRASKELAPQSPTDSVGTIPHTDRDAAAKIGRESGGEVFDD
jgi:hypothetical protein